MRFNRPVYFIQEHLHEEFYHGGIGPSDIERILLQEGAKALFFPYHDRFTLKAKLARLLFLVRMVLTLESNAVLLFQYPMYARIHYLFIRLLSFFRKRVKIVCLIDEINGLKYGDDRLLDWEKKYFTRFNYFIVHNESMKNWFNSQVPGRTLEILELFDFLAAPVTAPRPMAPVVAYAGNLAESGFQYKLSPMTGSKGTLQIHLYGLPAPGSTVVPLNVSYKGAFKPYDLPAKMEASFGLIWDGDSADDITGSFGHYMRFISHHKVSLYIISNMPCIVYEKAGTANFICRQGIGFTIRHLDDIMPAIDSLSEEDYQLMCANTRRLAQKLSNGEHLKRALAALLEKMEAAEVNQGKA